MLRHNSNVYTTKEQRKEIMTRSKLKNKLQQPKLCSYSAVLGSGETFVLTSHKKL